MQSKNKGEKNNLTSIILETWVAENYKRNWTIWLTLNFVVHPISVQTLQNLPCLFYNKFWFQLWTAARWFLSSLTTGSLVGLVNLNCLRLEQSKTKWRFYSVCNYLFSPFLFTFFFFPPFPITTLDGGNQLPFGKQERFGWRKQKVKRQ